MTDLFAHAADLPEAAPAALSPEFVAQGCGQTSAELVAQLFAAVEQAAPGLPEEADGAVREAAVLGQQRWYETLLRGALPAAVRTGSVAHLTRVKQHLAALPLSAMFMRQSHETAAVQGAAAGCVEAVLALLGGDDGVDDALRLAAATAAAAAGRLTVLQALLDDGLNDEALSRALIAAAAGEQLGAVTALLMAAGERASHVAQMDCGGITAIGAAAQVGALDVVRELWPWQATATRASALVNAAAQGAQSIVTWVLTQLAPEAESDDKPLWQAGLAQALRAAAAGGHAGIVQALLAKIGSQPPLAMLEEAFFAAAAAGQAPILATLHQAAGTQGDALLAARGDGVLQVAANGGNVDAIRWILDASGPRRQRILRADDDGAFCSAAAQGHVEAVTCLLSEVSQPEQPAMLAAYRWEPLREAAAAGHLPMVQHLLAALPEHTQEALGANDYEAFRRAAAGGHNDVVAHLLHAGGTEAPAMLASRAFAALTNAASHGHRDVVITLIGALSPNPKATLGEHCLAVLTGAAKHDDLRLLLELSASLEADDEDEQKAGVQWLTAHFLAAPGEPERHGTLHAHIDHVHDWAPHLDANVRRQALATCLADGEPILAALFQ